MFLVGPGPAAKTLVDREELQFGELTGVSGLGLLAGRAVVVAAGNVLAFVGIQVEVSVCDRARAFFVDVFINDGDTGLGRMLMDDRS